MKAIANVRVCAAAAVGFAAVLLTSCGGEDIAVGDRLTSEVPSQADGTGTKPDPGALPQRVTDTYYRLVPSEAMSLGFNIEINDAGQAAMHDCFAARGMEYLAPPDFAVRGAEPERDSRLRRAVEAGWAVPPNPEAAQFGLGLFAPLSAATELAPSEEWIEPSFSDASAEQVYNQVSADCGASISPASSSSFDSALMDQLHADFITIEADTKTLGGFQYLQDRYYACLEDRGLTTQEPRDLLRILEDSGVAGDKAAQLEVDLAVGDSTCRLPLYDDFILLNADAWESWLNERAADIDAVVKQFDYFEGVALDVWNSSKSTTSD